MNEYYVVIDGTEQGPFTINQLRSMWQAGRLTQKTNFRLPNMEEWLPLSDILDELEPKSAMSGSSGNPSPAWASMGTTRSGRYPGLVKSTKSRGVYIILGLFLGMLGIHNFYAGHNKSGIGQLLMTICLGWLLIGLVINFFWIMIELFTVTVDGQGDPLT